METFARVHTEPPLLLIEEVGRLPMIISNIILHSLLIPPALLFYGRKEIAFAILMSLISVFPPISMVDGMPRGLTTWPGDLFAPMILLFCWDAW